MKLLVKLSSPKGDIHPYITRMFRREFDLRGDESESKKYMDLSKEIQHISQVGDITSFIERSLLYTSDYAVTTTPCINPGQVTHFFDSFLQLLRIETLPPKQYIKFVCPVIHPSDTSKTKLIVVNTRKVEGKSALWLRPYDIGIMNMPEQSHEYTFDEIVNTLLITQRHTVQVQSTRNQIGIMSSMHYADKESLDIGLNWLLNMNMAKDDLDNIIQGTESTNVFRASPTTPNVTENSIKRSVTIRYRNIQPFGHKTGDEILLNKKVIQECGDPSFYFQKTTSKHIWIDYDSKKYTPKEIFVPVYLKYGPSAVPKLFGPITEDDIENYEIMKNMSNLKGGIQ